jgi:outer membrane protein TolC
MRVPKRLIIGALTVALTLAPAAGAGLAAEAPVPATAPAQAPAPPEATDTSRTLSQQAALDLALQYSLELQIANLQVSRARIGLDRVPEEAPQRQGAELSLQQAALGLDAARQNIFLNVTRAYVGWQKADALADAQAVTLERARAQAASVDAAVVAGTASRLDVLQAKAQTATQEAALAGATAGRRSALLALQRVIGTELDLSLEPAAPLPTADAAAPDPDLQVLIDRALSQRPEAVAAGLAVKARSLDLQALALPEDDPGATAARLAVQEAALQLTVARADIRLQVEQALLSRSSARERLRALTEGEAQAREALRLAQLRFDAGTATSVEVWTAQAALSQAEAGRIEAAADLAAGEAALLQATGDL